MKLDSILLPGVDPKRPLVIAGPCSAETEEQVMNTAKQLAADGIKILRAEYGNLALNQVDLKELAAKALLGSKK